MWAQPHPRTSNRNPLEVLCEAVFARPNLLLQGTLITEYGSSELRGEICYLNTPDNPHHNPWHDDDAVLASPFENADGPYDRYAYLCVRASIDTSGINNGATYSYRSPIHGRDPAPHRPADRRPPTTLRRTPVPGFDRTEHPATRWWPGHPGPTPMQPG